MKKSLLLSISFFLLFSFGFPEVNASNTDCNTLFCNTELGEEISAPEKTLAELKKEKKKVFIQFIIATNKACKEEYADSTQARFCFKETFKNYFKNLIKERREQRSECRKQFSSEENQQKCALKKEILFLENIDIEISYDQKILPTIGEEIAIISTKFGEIHIRLFPNKAPLAVENFVTHAKNTYYDGIIFHRVIDGFMIQGGDPTGTGMGGESIWGGKFEDEIDMELRNIRGALSMANAGKDTNGSQFFINQVDNIFLDGHENGELKECEKRWISCQTVFGQVFKGMNVVDQIAHAERDARDKPLEDIEMEIRIEEYEG